MIPLDMTTFGKLGPSAESYLKSLADVACSTGCVDRGVWLRIAKQFLSCALVRDRGIVFCHYCLLYTSPSPRDRQKSRMPSSA